MGTLKPGPGFGSELGTDEVSLPSTLSQDLTPRSKFRALKLTSEGLSWGGITANLHLAPSLGRLSRVQEVAHRGCADEFCLSLS